MSDADFSECCINGCEEEPDMICKQIVEIEFRDDRDTERTNARQPYCEPHMKQLSSSVDGMYDDENMMVEKEDEPNV